MNTNMVTAQNVEAMSSREIAELTGKNHADVMRDIRNMFNSLNLAESSFASSYLDANNQSRKCYNLPRFECEVLVTGYDVNRRAAVIKRWMELELNKQPALPTTYLEALEKLIETEKEKIAITHDRDEAIKTKALISDKKTATAMNTASRLSKENKLLQSKLQDVGEYLSVIAAGLPQRVATELNDNAQTWRVLMKICKEMKLPPKKVKDERYGEVNTYHLSVIHKFKADYLD